MQTNRFGVGARVYVQVHEDGPVQMREVNVRSNYQSHNEVIAHFGLGSGVTTVHSVRVEWPRIGAAASGNVQQRRNVQPNQLLTINENDPETLCDGAAAACCDLAGFACGNGIACDPNDAAACGDDPCDCQIRPGGDGIRDDNCVWCGCNQATGACDLSSIGFADMGGAFGACGPDGFCNLHDRNHALKCFAETSACDDLNVDAGGPFDDCSPDGLCDIHDANHALDCFAGATACSCGGGAPDSGASEPTVIAKTHLIAVADQALRSDRIDVRVFASGGLVDLRSYQLHLGASGGTAGQLELVDIRIEPRSDYVFARRSDAFSAFNVSKGQMLCGLDADAGVQSKSNVYLATFTYRKPKGATGEFVVDVLFDVGTGNRTFMIASGARKIDISGTTPAVIAAASARSNERSLRNQRTTGRRPRAEPQKPR